MEFTLSEKYTQEGWQLGAALRQTENSIRILPHAILTYNGKKLRQGLILQENTPVSHDPNWYSEVGAKNEGYSVRVLSFLATSHGAHHHFVFSGADLTSNQLKLGHEWEYARPYFTHETWNQINPGAAQLDAIHPPPPQFRPRADIEKNFAPELNALGLVFFTLQNYEADPQNAIREVPVTDCFLGLGGPGELSRYTRATLTQLIHDLHLTNEDLRDMHRTQKGFYRTLLHKIQHDLQHNPDSKFQDYAFLLGMELSADQLFDAADRQLVQWIEDVMTDVMGYMGYTLLKLDVVTLGAHGELIFQLPEDPAHLKNVVRTMGIKSLAHIDPDRFAMFLCSLLLSGHRIQLSTRNAEGEVVLTETHLFPGSDFLSGLTQNFAAYSTDPRYHLALTYGMVHSEMMEARLENIMPFRSFLSDPETLSKVLQLPTRIRHDLAQLDMTLTQLREIRTDSYDSAVQYLLDMMRRSKDRKWRKLGEDVFSKERHSLFDMLLNYYLNFESVYRNYAEYVESLEDPSNLMGKYPDETQEGKNRGVYWDYRNYVKITQRVLWGLLTDFRHPITGQKIESLNDWMSFPLHHWKTARGHENKYDCGILALIPVPGKRLGEDGAIYSLFHQTITQDVEAGNGAYWEERIGDIINLILEGKTPREWHLSKDERAEYEKNLKKLIPLIKSYFLTNEELVYFKS